MSFLLRNAQDKPGSRKQSSFPRWVTTVPRWACVQPLAPRDMWGLAEMGAGRPKGIRASGGTQREAEKASWGRGQESTAHHGLSAVQVLWDGHIGPRSCRLLSFLVHFISYCRQQEGSSDNPREGPGKKGPPLPPHCVPLGQHPQRLTARSKGLLTPQPAVPQSLLQAPCSGRFHSPSPGRARRLSWACSCWFC